MRRLTVFLALLVAIVVVPAGAAVGGGGGCHGGRQELSSTTVDLVDLCFAQTVVHVAPGDTVTWTNRDPVQHTVTGVGGEWGNYEPMNLGATFSNRFDAPGVYPYFCWLHPAMVGAVAVDTDTDTDSGSSRIAAAVPVSAVREDGSAALAWWMTGGLVLLLLAAGATYLLERVRSALPRG